MLTKVMFLHKIKFWKIAMEFGGKVRFANQYSMLWGGLNDDIFHKGFWAGICAGLAIEWIKERVRGNDLLKKILQMRHTLMANPQLTSTQKMVNSAFVRDVQDSHYSQADVETALAGICRPGNSSTHYYPFHNIAEGFARRRYHHIASHGHCMAAFVNQDKTVEFYDPTIGEVTGLSSTLFFPKYLKEVTDATSSITGDTSRKKPRIVVTQYNPCRRWFRCVL